MMDEDANEASVVDNADIALVTSATVMLKK